MNFDFSKQPRTISFSSLKGGAGKSSLAIIVAHNLSLNSKTLLVDCNFGAGSLNSLLGVHINNIEPFFLTCDNEALQINEKLFYLGGHYFNKVFVPSYNEKLLFLQNLNKFILNNGFQYIIFDNKTLKNKHDFLIAGCCDVPFLIHDNACAAKKMMVKKEIAFYNIVNYNKKDMPIREKTDIPTLMFSNKIKQMYNSGDMLQNIVVLDFNYNILYNNDIKNRGILEKWQRVFITSCSSV